MDFFSIILLVCLIVVDVAIIYLAIIAPSIGGKEKFEPFAGYLYAHRGYHDNATDAPENSLKAFALAVEHGYGMELDIQLTKDGKLVVFHDDTLERVCGVQGKIEEYTYQELQEFPLFGGEAKIPLFRDVLALVKGKTPIVVEYKTIKMNKLLCYEGNKMLRKYKGAYCIESFHPAVVYWYKKNHPDVVRGQLACPAEQKKFSHIAMQYLLLNCFTKPHFIAYDHNAKNNLSRRLCRSVFKNIAVAWTIQSQAEFDACKQDFDLYIFEGFAPTV